MKYHHHGRVDHGRFDGNRFGRHGREGGGERFARDLMDAGERFGGRHRAQGLHRGGRRRVFDHGDLRYVLLSMIAAKPSHGYDLIKALEDRMGGGYSPSPGVIYPTLTMLEEQGYASVAASDGKKLYQATEEGVTFLKANQAVVEAIQARIDSVAQERRVMLDPRIIRALENLKMALRLRLAGDAMTEERAQAVAAAIDAAAAEAERM